MQEIGVLFDVDGVLVDSYDAHYEAWKQFAARHGRRYTEQQFAAGFGRTSREVLADQWHEKLTDEQARQYSADKEAIYLEIVRKEFPEMPGARDLLQALSEADIPFAVGSSGPPPNVEIVLRHLGALEQVGAMITGADVTVGKPAPQVFLLAAAAINLNPHRCVVFEDAPAGIEAGRSAGCRCIGVASRGRTREELSRADLVIDQLSEVTPDMLRGLVNE